MSTRMSRTVEAFLLLSILLLPRLASGGDRPRVLAVSSPSTGLELTFLSAPAGVVDAGTIAWHGGARRTTVTTRTIRTRIGQPSAEPRGTATLQAFLEIAEPRCTIRVDGVVLTTVPRVIRRHAPIGVPISHRIDIEVPADAADGALLTSIGWEVSTD